MGKSPMHGKPYFSFCGEKPYSIFTVFGRKPFFQVFMQIVPDTIFKIQSSLLIFEKEYFTNFKPKILLLMCKKKTST